VVDSYGLVAICLDRQSAAADLGLGAGDEVSLEAGDARRDNPPVSAPVTLRLAGE